MASSARIKEGARAFEACEIAGLSLRNRIVMAPMTRRQATEDGFANEQMLLYYSRFAKHGVGMIITEGVHVDDIHADDRSQIPFLAHLRTPLIGRDSDVDAWLPIVEACHAHGAKFVMQLWHTGSAARNPIGPIAFTQHETSCAVRAMDAGDLESTLGSYVEAAKRAERAGFDGVQLHGAHGYLLDSFMAPTNNRSDGYGGDLLSRMRYPLEAARAVRAALRPETRVLYRFSQWWEFGRYDDKKFTSPQELATFVRALEGAGVDILDASTYCIETPGFPEAHPSRTLAGWVKYLATCPVIGVGGICNATPFQEQVRGDVELSTVTSPAGALALVESGEIDLVAVGRSLLANPDWVEVVSADPWGDAYRRLQPFKKSMLKSLDPEGWSPSP